MPAQSPTLSPTLSAITAGLRGSSSGMPASILPTRSAPTSAALVKMPPPSRANTEISEPPKPRPISASTAWRGLSPAIQVRIAVVAGDADQGEPDDEHAGDRAAAEGDVERLGDAAAGRLGDAGVGADRDVHADVAGGGREQAADREADRDADVLQRDQDDEQDHADAGDRRVLAVEVRATRPPGRRPRSSACARCRATAPAAPARSRRRRRWRRPRRRARRRRRDASES